MAVLHNADLTPSKLELLQSWAPTQDWWPGIETITGLAGAYRFDDPDGEVGIETHLLRTDTDVIVQVPLTYRAAPVDGAEGALIMTMDHSVLGLRWIYDGCFDPVYVAALATAIRTGGTQAELRVLTADGPVVRAATTTVVGSGTDADSSLTVVGELTVASDQAATTIRTGDLELIVRRAIHGDLRAPDALTLTGVWPGRDEPTTLALARQIS